MKYRTERRSSGPHRRVLWRLAPTLSGMSEHVSATLRRRNRSPQRSRAGGRDGARARNATGARGTSVHPGRWWRRRVPSSSGTCVMAGGTHLGPRRMDDETRCALRSPDERHDPAEDLIHLATFERQARWADPGTEELLARNERFAALEAEFSAGFEERERRHRVERERGSTWPSRCACSWRRVARIASLPDADHRVTVRLERVLNSVPARLYRRPQGLLTVNDAIGRTELGPTKLLLLGPVSDVSDMAEIVRSATAIADLRGPGRRVRARRMASSETCGFPALDAPPADWLVGTPPEHGFDDKHRCLEPPRARSPVVPAVRSQTPDSARRRCRRPISSK
jgi:hypothetical protein